MAVEDSGAGLASSLTDLMTSLAVIFILLLVASRNNDQQAVEKTRSDILAELQRKLQEFVAQGVEVKTDPKDPLSLWVLVPQNLLGFSFGKDEIPLPGIQFLEDFVPRLAETACSHEFRENINSIVVEGHTDSVGTDEYNIRLSQNRSLRVVLESLHVLGAQQDSEVMSSLRSCFLDFLSASGRGKVEAIGDQTTEEGRARSRRVVFKIRVKSSEQQQVREVLQSATPQTIWSPEWQSMTLPPTSLAPWNLSR